tara:strand:+ start:1356 stop:1892 length:537 start_codon:yes stop_codon:yes gene_type:complete
MEKLQYIELGPKESWPKSAYSSEGTKDERGEHGNWYDYLNISRRNEALKGMKKLREQCLRKGTDVKRIVIEYTGYGDSGDEIYAFADLKNKYEYEGYPGSFCDDENCPDLKKYLGAEFESMAFDALFQLVPGGWEINEGSQGHLIWDIVSNKVEVNHEWNVRTTESENSEAEISFEGV